MLDFMQEAIWDGKKLSDLKVYQIAMDIGEFTWAEVGKWKSFDKETLGKQMVRSADSIALNISEGFGRFHFKENKNFVYFARGSYFETMTAFRKALNRNLISLETFNLHKAKFLLFHKLINAYIKSIGNVSPIKNNILEEEQMLYPSVFNSITESIDEDGINDLLTN